MFFVGFTLGLGLDKTELFAIPLTMMQCYGHMFYDVSLKGVYFWPVLPTIVLLALHVNWCSNNCLSGPTGAVIRLWGQYAYEDDILIIGLSLALSAFGYPIYIPWFIMIFFRNHILMYRCLSGRNWKGYHIWRWTAS